MYKSCSTWSVLGHSTSVIMVMQLESSLINLQRQIQGGIQEMRIRSFSTTALQYTQTHTKAHHW